MRLLILILFLIPNIVFAGPMKMIGEKGNPSEANRTITIKMYDNYFEPAQIQITKDETTIANDNAIAVSLNKVPAIPSININGKKTATKIRVVAIIAKVICFDPL